MAVTGDKLYVLTSADGKSGMDIFDLKNFIQERQVSLGQKGLGVETLVARDARVYGIRPYNPTTEEAAAILEFNTTNRTSKLIGTDGIQAYFEGVPAAVKPMGGDSILLAQLQRLHRLRHQDWGNPRRHHHGGRKQGIPHRSRTGYSLAAYLRGVCR